MIPENRKKQILAILKQHGYCSVEQLAQSVYVSLPTMRRDLTQLEQEGLIKRIHGGASYFKGDMPMMPFALRNQAMIKEKIRIGEAAARLLKDHDTVFFDACSTCLCMVRAIDPNLRLHALSNSIAIVQALAEYANIQSELIGGTYDAKSLSNYGPQAEAYITQRHARWCFVTANSVDETYGMSNITSIDIPLKRAFAQHADQVVLLVDSSRMERKNYYKVFDFADIDLLITDAKPSDGIVQKCLEQRVQLIIA